MTCTESSPVVAWRRHLPPAGRSEAIADIDIAAQAVLKYSSSIAVAAEHMQVKLEGLKDFPMTACERILVACGPCATVPFRAFRGWGSMNAERVIKSWRQLDLLSKLYRLTLHIFGERNTEKMSGRFAPKVPVQLDPPKDDPISLEDLAKADGKPP